MPIGKTFIKTQIVKITKCSFTFMWYSKKIGKTYEVISMKKRDIFIPTDVESYECRTIEPPFEDKPDLEGWLLNGDYEVISESTREIQKN